MSDQMRKFPLVAPEGSDAEMFIQWKGTDVCFDFWCPCGQASHFDGLFANAVKCPKCETVYDLGTQVIIRKRPENPDYFIHEPHLLDGDDE